MTYERSDSHLTTFYAAQFLFEIRIFRINESIFSDEFSFIAVRFCSINFDPSKTSIEKESFISKSSTYTTKQVRFCFAFVQLEAY